MNHCAIQQKHAFAACEEMRSSMICPKPRRVGVFNSTFNDPVRSHLRWHYSNQADIPDSTAGTDLMDIIFSKGGSHGFERSNTPQLVSSPPFYSGSPPSRLANPIIQDARFGDGNITPISSVSNSGRSSSPSTRSGNRKGGCVRANFGNNPAVRVEGFGIRAFA